MCVVLCMLYEEVFLHFMFVFYKKVKMFSFKYIAQVEFNHFSFTLITIVSKEHLIVTFSMSLFLSLDYN